MVAELNNSHPKATISLPTGPAGGFAAAAGWWGPALIVAYWLFNCLFVSTAGNFPLNDDWIYSESVQHMMRTGQFHLIGCSPACLLHVVLGTVWCSVVGFSHDNLRLLTNLLGLGGALLTYATLRSLDVNRAVSALAGLLLCANPLYVNLCYSFMTDVPALFFFSAYLLCLLKAVKSRSVLFAILSGAALTGAILIRQTFAVFALPSLACALFVRGAGWQLRTALVVTGALIPLLAGSLSERLMMGSNDFAEVYVWYKSLFSLFLAHLIKKPITGAGQLFEQLFQVFAYFGLFCLPLIPLLTPQLLGELKKRNRLMWASCAIALAISIPSALHLTVMKHQLMPFSQNLMRLPMIGPLNLMGICVDNLKSRPRLYLTVVAAAAGIVLLTWLLHTLAVLAVQAVQSWRRPQQAGADAANYSPALALSTTAAVALGMVCLQTCVINYDRYYLMALPVVLVLLGTAVKSTSKLAWTLAGVLTLGMAAYSTAATQDYLSWNRARWQAIRELESHGVAPTAIDGGVEYNNLVNPKLVKACLLTKRFCIMQHRGKPPYCDWRWWSINGEDYVVAFNTMPGYDTIATHDYYGALTMSRRTIYTLRKQAP